MDYEKETKDIFAKLHPEMLDWAKAHYSTFSEEDKKFWDGIFPELSESEDEKIRKWLIDYFNYNNRFEYKGNSMPSIKSILDYLERKKEQKPTGEEYEVKVGRSTHRLKVGSRSDIEKLLRQEKEQEVLPGFEQMTPEEKMNHPLYLEGFDVGRKVGQVETEQKPISDMDIVPYIDDKIAELQDLWREQKVAFDWDDMKEMIEDIAHHFYRQEQKPNPYILCKSIKNKIKTYIANHFITDEVVKTDVASIVHAMEEGVRLGMAEQNLAEWSEEDEEDEEGQRLLAYAYDIMYRLIPQSERTQEFWDALAYMRCYTGRKSHWKPSEEGDGE